MIVILFSFLNFLWPKHITAITLWPFIIFKERKASKNKTIINHENIHLRQQLELLVLPFYFIYLFEYLILLIIHRNHNKAYRSISFEREAYQYEKEMNYLKTRQLWAMWRL